MSAKGLKGVVYVQNIFVESGTGPFRVGEEFVRKEGSRISNTYSVWFWKGKAIGFVRSFPALLKTRRQNSSPDLRRLFLPPHRVTGHIEPYLKDVRDRQTVTPDRSTEDRLALLGYS